MNDLAHDFPLMSDLSRRAPHAIADDEIQIELLEEERQRIAHYPELVRKARLTQEQADRHFAILRQIRLDNETPGADVAGDALGRWWRDWAARRAASPVSWEDKVRELRRELAIRRRLYPQRIARLVADEQDLRVRMERLEAVHWRYWIDLQFLDAAPPALAPADAYAAREVILRLAADREHWAAAALRRADRAIAGAATIVHRPIAGLLAWYDAGGREQLLGLYPDLSPPALDTAA